MVGAGSFAHAAPGNVDSGFGTAGRVVTDFGAEEGAGTMLVLPAGQIIAAGSISGSSGLSSWTPAPAYGHLAIAKYAVDGHLDPSWGGDGRVTTDLGIPAVATDLAMQPDGKLVVAGAVYACCDRYHFLARYNPDGTLDGSFGPGGFVTFHFLPAYGIDDDPGRPIALVAVRSDGRIVIAGTAQSRFAVARFSASGALEQVSPTFLATPGFNILGELMLLPDDRVVLAGFGANADWVLVRYLPSGFVDTSFGTSGYTVTNVGDNNGELRTAVLQPDGRIVAAGIYSPNGIKSKFVVARFGNAGFLDPTFSGDGITTTKFAGVSGADGIALQPNGKIVVAGWSFDSTAGATFALARYRANGLLDLSFGNSGKTRTVVGSGAMAWDVGIGPTGRIIAAGASTVANNDFALVAYQS
jgi:uncharacterized delta-60 repeat protein